MRWSWKTALWSLIVVPGVAVTLVSSWFHVIRERPNHALERTAEDAKRPLRCLEVTLPLVHQVRSRFVDCRTAAGLSC